MTDWFAVMPCSNGCITTDGNVAVASHGAFCARCHDMARLGLTNAAPLVGHLVSQVAGLMSKPGNAGNQRTKASSAPLPLNARAFDDANQVYRLLVGWSLRMAEKLGQPLPAAAAGAWRNEQGKVVGLPNGVGVIAARAEVARLAKWHLDRLEAILALPDSDTVSFYLLDVARLQRINLRWPTEDKPTFSRKAACPDDSKPLLIVPPREFGADQGIVCSACGRHFTDAEHERLAAYFSAVAKATKRKAAMDAWEAQQVDALLKPPTEPIAIAV